MLELSAWERQFVEALRREIDSRISQPESTYRLQFDRQVMPYRRAAEIVPYLRDLGISHLYTSPDRKSRAGSPHGYAIVDYDSLNPELGNAEDHQALVAALKAAGMGRIPDIVPNHMSAAPGENPWWTDVLENGPGSPYAAHFDIDWDPVKEELRNRLLLPLLGQQYGEVLESGQMRIEFRDGAFSLRLYDSLLPLDPKTYPQILARNLQHLKEILPADSPDLLELESILTALDHLPDRNLQTAEAVRERQREKEVIKKRLAQLAAQSPPVAESISAGASAINGVPGSPESFDDLDRLLNAQVYRLAHWRSAGDEINYRRFFDINDLAAVCMEDPAVFEQSHRIVFAMLLRGELSGLRIDHIDGLFDPTDYLWKLQRGWVRTLGAKLLAEMAERAHSAPQAESAHRARHDADASQEACGVGLASSAVGQPWPAGAAPPHANAENLDRPALVPSLAAPHSNGSSGPFADGHSDPPALPSWSDVEPAVLQEIFGSQRRSSSPLFVVVEKILGPDEPLPRQWPVAGTTGYDYLHWVNGVFVDAEGLHALRKLFNRFADGEADFREVVYESKQLILRSAMATELQLLARRLNRLSERHRRFRDFTLNMLRRALRATIACFGAYRTYLRPQEISERDRRFVVRAVAQAKRRNPDLPAGALDFVRDVLLFEQPAPLGADGCRERELFVGRFQQVTSPVMAKGVEDTAFYRYFPLSSLNEVGDDPSGRPVTLDDFHRENAARQSAWPGSLLATTTHDTKRSEDARARINVLSEIPQEWGRMLNRWARVNRRYRRDVDGSPAPSRADEYLFYQSLLAIWPLDPPDEQGIRDVIGRMQSYMQKAAYEAKVRTSWLNPSAEYDDALRQFIAAALEPSAKNRFLAQFAAFQAEVARFGLFNALAQVLLKLTSPGIPDIYQGQELWDFSLVDPDNRRSVDFALRERLLAELRRDAAAGPAARRDLARRLARNPSDPRLKLFVVWQTLQFRRLHAEFFRAGRYLPLVVSGARSEHVCAYAWQKDRPVSGGNGDHAAADAAQAPGELGLGPHWSPNGSNDRENGKAPLDSARETAVVIVPRFLARMARALDDPSAHAELPFSAAAWGDTRVELPSMSPQALVDLFTGQTFAANSGSIPLADVCSEFPVAILT